MSVSARKSVSSRQQLAIDGVRDGILMLPRFKYRTVLAVSSLNFELKSEAEQDGIIDNYGAFLNSLGMDLQIIVRTRQVDLDKYLDDLNKHLAQETSPLYRQQLADYNDFIRSLVKSNKILTRRFYVVLPYDLKTKTDFEIIKEQLDLRSDIVAKSLNRLGIAAWRLSDIEILELFYDFYNPQRAKDQPLNQQMMNLVHTTLVKSKKEQA